MKHAKEVVSKLLLTCFFILIYSTVNRVHEIE